MRLRQRDLRPFVVKKRITQTEPDGTTYEAWESVPVPNPAWPANAAVNPDDGVPADMAFDADEPNYKFWEQFFGPAHMGPVKPGEYGYVIFANVQPAGGRVMAEMYGERLAYMLTMYAERSAKISEFDGVCVNVLPGSDPDYQVVAIRPWRDHLQIELERIRP